MAEMTDPARITVVPTGVDVSQYRAAAERRAATPLVLFLGSMDWEANVDAVDYFCRDIWPQVRAAVPAARFRIVGRNPHPRVRRLASESVEVTGSVPSVVEHLGDAAVFVVPLRIGGGTRLKIFEAMAMEAPVVATSEGGPAELIADGIDGFLLPPDAPERWAAVVTRLLEDSRLRLSVVDKARSRASAFDVPAHVNAVLASYSDALAGAVARDA
jgi:glycosyltransferase involved in cell wall biosynthesis